MTLDRKTMQSQQAAVFAAVRAGLGSIPAEFSTAGDLAALMARLPADTPVSVAETVRIDPALQLGDTDNRTAAVATVRTLVDGADPVDVLENDGQVRTYGRLIPGVELGAVIVAEGTPAPVRTTPFPPFERAQEALQAGDLHAVLDAQIELLTWMAGTLTTGPIRPDLDDDQTTTPDWLADDDLRQQLAVEATRLRHTVARLTTLRERATGHRADSGEPR